ncbi:MAG: cell division protein FtsA [Rickettsiaceae bacterium]
MKGKSANYIVFDIGSNKVAAIAANIDKTGESKIIAQVLQRSNGFKAGAIVDLEAAENSIIAAIYSLEKECDRSINEVVISLSGGVKSYYISHTLKLSNQPISKQDIKKLIQKALADFSIKDQEIIHYFPIEFTLDNNNIVDNPSGMYARELTCQIHVIAANSLTLKNLTNCFAKCHIEVTDVVLSIYADGLVCLTDDEKETGGIIIDMGSNITNFGIFFEGKILYVGSVPIGSYHVTSDIARILAVSMNTAEKLKILYGDVRPELFNKNESIRISDFEPDNNYNLDLTVSVSELSKIVRSRVEEILTLLKKDYDYISMDHLIAKRIVLTGGGSGLQGIKNLVTEIFQKQVRLARLEHAPEFIDNVNIAIYSTAMGMIKSKALKYKKNSFKPGEQEDQGWFRKMFLWFKENI